MKPKIYRYKQLIDMLQISRTTIWRRINTDQSFPKPIKLGENKNCRAQGFKSDEVDKWLSDRQSADKKE